MNIVAQSPHSKYIIQTIKIKAQKGGGVLRWRKTASEGIILPSEIGEK